MSVKVFLGPEIAVVKNDIGVKEIIDGFILYKKTGNPGQLFGADVPTERPKEARENKLYHAHLLDKKTFQLKRLQLKPQEKRTSDTFLMYCSGYNNPTYYLLIGIIWNDAHARLRDGMDRLIRYGKEAEKFRSIY